MANEYELLHANVEERFLSLRNHHAASAGVFDALQQMALAPLAEPLSGADRLEAAGERIAAAFASCRAACVEAVEEHFGPAFDATASAAESATTSAGVLGETWQADAQSLLDGLQAFEAADGESRGAEVRAHDAYQAAVQAMAAAFSEAFERLHRSLEAYAGDVAGGWQPAYLDGLRSGGERIEALHRESLVQADAEHRDALSAGFESFVEVGEEVGNAYSQLAQDALGDAARYADEQFRAAWERQVEELKASALEVLGDEIAESIVETHLSVAISGALSPVMPELIAFYKAADALEDAIRIWKELKDKLGF